ncbi:MAG TPA: hypothetical protein VMY78_12675 [Solirubrobacteraceae bacterium]|nr:hypothetical protein [Solirubrobacteraceae bacterium]
MARVTRRVVAVVAPILAALALVACGDSGTATSDRNAYAEKVNDAQTTFATTVTSVARGAGAKSSVSQQQRTLRRFESAIEGVVADLKRIDPPEEVADEHEQLISVLSRFGSDISQANDAMSNPTPRTIASAQRRVQAATQSVNSRVNGAIAAINAKLRAT